VTDDDPVESPVIRAVMVAGSAPDTEAVHVLVVWDDLDEACQTVHGLLPQLRKNLETEPRFGGELTFFLPTEFIDDTRRNRNKVQTLQNMLVSEASEWRTASGRSWTVSVKLGV
jgi:hypothetical protein